MNKSVYVSQYDLAKFLRVHQTSISDWTNKKMKKRPSVHTVAQLQQLHPELDKISYNDWYGDKQRLLVLLRKAFRNAHKVRFQEKAA